MSADIACPACGATSSYRPEFPGKRGRCTRRKEPFELAAASQDGVVRQGPSPPPPRNVAFTQETALVSCAASHNKTFKVTQSARGPDSVSDILEYTPVRGCQGMGIMQFLCCVQQQGMMLNQARIALDRG